MLTCIYVSSLAKYYSSISPIFDSVVFPLYYCIVIKSRQTFVVGKYFLLIRGLFVFFFFLIMSFKGQ